MAERDLARLLGHGEYLEAIRTLEAAGYVKIGRGDWSRTFRRGDDPEVVRLTPFDPAFRLFAEAQLDDPVDGFVAIHAVLPLGPTGFATVMAFGERVDQDAARRFCDALPLPVETRIDALVAEGRKRWTFFGGRDVHLGNVLMTDRLVLTDPVFIDGPRLRTAILEADVGALAAYDIGDLRAFSHLPFFAKDGEGALFSDGLIAAVDQLAHLSAQSS